MKLEKKKIMGLAFREHNKNYWYYSKVYVLGVMMVGLGSCSKF